MRIPPPTNRSPLVIIFALLAGCEGPTAPTDLRQLSASVQRGQMAFARECATCHASFDAIDLAFFNFADTTIVRRAVAHVDTATAKDIVAFVHSRTGPRASRSVRLFQPGGVILANDLAFATALFGANQWPAGLTADALRAIDPARIPAAVAMPLWSHETSNVDWMPDAPLPDALLDFPGATTAPRSLLAAYRGAPTAQALTRVVQALRAADRRLANPAAPCVFDVEGRLPDYVQCFEARRWTSTLAAQHMLRGRLTDRPPRGGAEVWWDVGNAARKAVHAGGAIAHGARNWASWMYLGWIFEPGRFPSVYTGNGLIRLGLPRHATFVALRSAVARPAGSFALYADLESTARFAPAPWAVNAVQFGLSHALERARNGDLPPVDRRAEAREHVDSAYAVAARKVPIEQRPGLRRLADELLAALP